MRAFIFLLILFFTGLIFLITDIAITNPEPGLGILVDKHYKPEHNTTSVGVVYTSNGANIVSTGSQDNEAYILMVKSQSGKIIKINCNPEQYYDYKLNDSIKYVISKGVFTDTDWFIKITN